MESRKAWDGVPVGKKITSLGLLRRAKVKKTETSVKRFSSFLGRMVKKGEAIRIKEANNRLVHYQKVNRSRIKLQRIKTQRPTTEFNLHQLGESILRIIDERKNEIKMLKDQLKQSHIDMRALVDQKKELDELYMQAQEKILALNSGKGKSIKLNEL